MIVQPRRTGGLRLFRQHDHALASGDLALAWLEAGADPPVSEILVTATALHDLSWRDADRTARWNPDSGRPWDFQDYPVDRKFEAFAENLYRVEEIDAYAALLVSLHYATFASAPDWFVESQARLQDRLATRVGRGLPDEEEIETDLGLLRLFDVLSLYLCLAPPEARAGARPTWLGDTVDVPGWDEALSVRWTDLAELVLDPWPLDVEAVTVDLPYRDLDGERFESAEALARAWSTAPRGVWRPMLRSP